MNVIKNKKNIIREIKSLYFPEIIVVFLQNGTGRNDY